MISIHSPRMGRDPFWPVWLLPAMIFQSTLPAWGETAASDQTAPFIIISIHSPRMGRDVHICLGRRLGGISIHSPRMGRDGNGKLLVLDVVFQSTLPAWGETCTGWRPYPSLWHFNPLSPHGERPGADVAAAGIGQFQSTLPAWGETANAHNFSKRKTGASAQHCIFSPAKRFFLLTKNFLEKRNKPFFRCEPYRKTVGAPVSHQPLKN